MIQVKIEDVIYLEVESTTPGCGQCVFSGKSDCESVECCAENRPDEKNVIYINN